MGNYISMGNHPITMLQINPLFFFKKYCKILTVSKGLLILETADLI